MISEATYMLSFSFYGFSMQILGFTFEVFPRASNSAQNNDGGKMRLSDVLLLCSFKKEKT